MGAGALWCCAAAFTARVPTRTNMQSTSFIFSFLQNFVFFRFFLCDSLALSLLENLSPGSPWIMRKRTAASGVSTPPERCQTERVNLAQIQPDTHMGKRFNGFAKTAAPPDPGGMRPLAPLSAHLFKPAAAIHDPPAKDYQRHGQQDAPQQRKHQACACIERKEQKPEHFPLHFWTSYPAILTRIGRYGS